MPSASLAKGAYVIMDIFSRDISGRLTELKRGDFKRIKEEIVQSVLAILPEEYKQKHAFLNDFSIAFFDLYNANAVILYDSYILALKDYLTGYCLEAEQEYLKFLTVEDDLNIQCIHCPKSETQIEWEIRYEMDLNDTIFHICFEGWQVRTISESQ